MSRFHFTLCRYFLGHVTCQNLSWQGFLITLEQVNIFSGQKKKDLNEQTSMVRHCNLSLYANYSSRDEHAKILAMTYRIYSINRPGRLLNFWTLRVGAYSRWALIKFSPFSASEVCLFCNKTVNANNKTQ